MKKNKQKKIIELIDSLNYGKITINKQAGKIINIKKVKSIKL